MIASVLWNHRIHSHEVSQPGDTTTCAGHSQCAFGLGSGRDQAELPPPDPPGQPQRAGLEAIKQVFEDNRADSVLTQEIGEIAFHALRNYCVKIHAAPAGSLEQVLIAYSRDELSRLHAPTHASDASGTHSPAAISEDNGQ